MNKKKFKLDQQTLLLLIIIVVMYLFMAIVKGSMFVSVANTKSMLKQLAEQGMFVLCIGLVYLNRGMDLSIVNCANMVNVAALVMCKKFITESTPAGQEALIMTAIVIVGLLMGVAAGLINGFFVAKLNVPPMLVTLATQSLFLGVCYILTGGLSIVGFPEYVAEFGSAYLFGVIPYVTIVFLLVYVVLSIIVHKTPYGLRTQWLGSNKDVTAYAGINNAKVIFTTYIISGVIAAITGFLIAAMNNAASPVYGGSYVFRALIVAVLAGIYPTGGRGKMYNVILSVVAVQILITGFTMFRMSPLFRDSLFGFLLIGAIAIDYVTNKTKERALNRRAAMQKTSE